MSKRVLLTALFLTACGPPDTNERPVLRVHRVEYGETVTGISALYGVPRQVVVALNWLENPDVLTAPRGLVLPDGPTTALLPELTAEAPPPLRACEDVEVFPAGETSNPDEELSGPEVNDERITEPPQAEPAEERASNDDDLEPAEESAPHELEPPGVSAPYELQPRRVAVAGDASLYRGLDGDVIEVGGARLVDPHLAFGVPDQWQFIRVDLDGDGVREQVIATRHSISSGPGVEGWTLVVIVGGRIVTTVETEDFGRSFTQREHGCGLMVTRVDHLDDLVRGPGLYWRTQEHVFDGDSFVPQGPVLARRYTRRFEDQRFENPGDTLLWFGDSGAVVTPRPLP